MEGETGPGGSDLSGENFGDYSGPGGPASIEALAAAVQGMNLTDKANVDLAGVMSPQHSSGVSYADLAALEQAGFGKTDIPGFSQNIEQALAAQNVHNVLNYVAPAIASMVPGYGAISTIGRVGSGLLSGTMTPGQALSMGLAGALGAKTGLPSGIFEGLFEGNPGKAAGAGAQGGLAALTSALTGNPYAGAIASATLGPSLGRSVSEAVGGSSTKGGGLAGMLDQGLGTSNWGGLFGGASAPSQGSAPTGNTYGDTGINPETYAVTAAIEQAAQEFKQPTREREMVAGRYGPITNYEFGA
jgi:hypothetical protein